ncbi:hypothetical protein BDZ94DRAFT_1327742 [Collybia nuda]|uniref:Uncharacterized protein n=1 Tax=Collybia nuda TaxID=64659 RepID=A0A9P5YI83_9AGAR|nr:hypothetical protein BDZ94DRAFT_1327742 [Collybia nuda]
MTEWIDDISVIPRILAGQYHQLRAITDHRQLCYSSIGDGDFFYRLGLSLGTNFTATTFISYVYWLHRRDMAAGLGNHQLTQAERVLALLVESGIAFCILQVGNFIYVFFMDSFPSDTPGSYIGMIFHASYFGLSAMYPTVVIVLVNTHRTLDTMRSLDASLRISGGAERSQIATLHFASPERTDSPSGLHHANNVKEQK